MSVCCNGLSDLPLDLSGRDTHDFHAAKPNRCFLALVLVVIPVALSTATQASLTLSVVGTGAPRSCCPVLCDAEAFGQQVPGDSSGSLAASCGPRDG